MTYELNVSVEQHEEDVFIFVPEPLVEDETGNNGFIVDPVTGVFERINLANAQQLNDPNNLVLTNGTDPTDGRFFFTFDDNAVGNIDFDFGGTVSSSTPYARIIGKGDGSYDVYSFTVNNNLLNPPAIVGTVATDSVASPVDEFFSEITLGISGTAKTGDVWSLGLRHRSYDVTVGTTTYIDETDMTTVRVVTTTEDIATAFLQQLPERYAASSKTVVTATDIRLTIADPTGFNLVGSNGERSGLVQTIQSSGTVSVETSISNNGTDAKLLGVDLEFSGARVVARSSHLPMGRPSL